MQFSDTTNKNGLIQDFEQWCGLTDATISGDATQLAVVTSWINNAYADVLPMVLSYTDYIRWDDVNHTDQPWGTFNIVSGQSDYQIKQDDNSLDILNLTGMRIKTSSSGSDFEALERMTIDDPRAELALSPNSGDTGIPTHFLEKGNSVFLYPQPNYSSTGGGKIFFERIPDYFTSGDTTQEPGIPQPFHQLLSMRASRRWLNIYKPDNANLITLLNSEIDRKEKELSDLIEKRNPVRRRMTAPYQGDRGFQSGSLNYFGGDSNR